MEVLALGAVGARCGGEEIAAVGGTVGGNEDGAVRAGGFDCGGAWEAGRGCRSGTVVGEVTGMSASKTQDGGLTRLLGNLLSVGSGLTTLSLNPATLPCRVVYQTRLNLSPRQCTMAKFWSWTLSVEGCRESCLCLGGD